MTYDEIWQCLLNVKRNKPIKNQPCRKCIHFSEYKRTRFTCGVACVDFKKYKEKERGAEYDE